MNELTTEIIAALAQKQDLDEVFRHHLEIAINQLLQTELAEFLGYERYSYAGINTGNNRNGSYERSFDTKYGQLNLTIPRDRNGRFENHTLPAYGRHSDNLETTVIQLYTKGIKSEPSGLRKTTCFPNSLAHRTTWLRSDLLISCGVKNMQKKATGTWKSEAKRS